MNKIQSNIAANYLGRIWGFISVFVFVPFYLQLLGIESYAIIQFYAVIMGILVFADAGLTTTLNREFARCDKDDDYRANLLRTIEYVYIPICLTIITCVFITAPWIAKYWLNIEELSMSETTLYIRLIGVGVAFQLITTLYQGGLMGLQKQVLANGLQIGWSILRSGMVLIPLYFFPSLKLYFIWQAVLNAMYFLVCKIVLQNRIKSTSSPSFQLQYLKGVWRFALGVMCMALLSSILIQMDKLVASKMFSLVNFSYYMLASTLAQVPIIVVNPISLAVFPQLTQLVSEKKKLSLIHLFRSYSFIITSIAALVTFILIAYMKDILFIWTRDAELADSVYKVARVLSIGTLFQSVQLMPFHLNLANGHTKTNVKMGIGSVLFMLPTLIFLIHRFGLNGAGYPWLIMSFVTFFILGYITLKKFMNGQFKVWLIRDILLPMSLTFVVVTSLYLITIPLPKGYFVILYTVLISVIASFCSFFAFHKIHPEINMKGLLTQFFIKKK